MPYNGVTQLRLRLIPDAAGTQGLVDAVACLTRLSELEIRKYGYVTDLSPFSALCSLTHLALEYVEPRWRPSSARPALPPSLQALVLCNGYMHEEAVVRPFAQALSTLQGLLNLNLEGCEISDSGCKAISRSLTCLTTLTALELAANAFTAEGLMELQAPLLALGRLRWLNLAGNVLGDAGAVCLTALLPQMPALRDVDFSYTETETLKVANALKYAARKLSQSDPRRFYLLDMSIPHSVMKAETEMEGSESDTDEGLEME
jgi:Leucine Rich repeat